MIEQKMKKHIYTLKTALLLALLLPGRLHAQETQHISLDEAVGLSATQNSSIRQSMTAELISEAEYRQTDAVYLPQVTLGYTVMATDNPLNAFGFLLQQSRVTATDFDPAKLNSPGTRYNFSTGVEVKVPIVNVDMWYRRRSARVMKDVPKYQTQYTRERIRFEVQKAYTQLQFAYASKEILTRTLADVRTIRTMVENFYKQGLIQKSDLLNADVEVNTIESALAKAASSIANASDGLWLLMGDRARGERTVLKTDSLQQLERTDAEAVFSPFRPDIMAMQTGLEAAAIMTESLRKSFLPRLNAFGSYQFNEKNPFRFKSDSYMVGINLSWDVFNGHQTRNKIAAARLQQDKLRLQLQQHIDQSRLETEKNRRDISDLTFEIRQHESSISQAREALRIMTNRYREGLVSTTDLLMAQAQLSRKELEKAQAVMNYNINSYYQQLLTAKK